MSKKTFKENPALQFISTPTEEIQSSLTETEAPAGVPMKPNPFYIETRSKRLNLLIQPSLHSKLKNSSESHDVSMNELIHKVLEEYIDSEKL